MGVFTSVAGLVPASVPTLLAWVAAGQWGIKIVLLIVVAVGLVYVSRLQGARDLALRRILALLFAVLAAVAIIYPPVISAVAAFLGVGRGTDLLLYMLVIVVLATWLVQWRYNIAVQARLTELTRALALSEAGRTTPNDEPKPDTATADPS